MNLDLQNQISELEHKVKIWNLFSIEVSKQDDDIIKANGLQDYQMVWTDGKLDYYFDHSTLNLIDQYVAINAGIITDVRFNVSNYSVRKGKAECLKQIEIEISNLHSSIKSLKLKL